MSLQNATQRAIQRINGNDTYTLLAEAPGNKIFILDLAVPTGMVVYSITAKTLSGTVTVNLQKVSGGVTTSLSGGGAVAVTSTAATTTLTVNGANVNLAVGDTLQITTSAGATPIDLAVSVNYLKASGNQ